MAHLTLARVSDDGKRLLLLDDRGAEFTLDVTPALRAALRGDATRLGQLEIPMDSALRPRDIQARIRAGETPEQVAQVAHTSVEKIMPFVAPVLAEREHVAERSQWAHLRRLGGESGAAGARTLGEVVSRRLRAQNIDPDVVRWDAWRREDGRWTLRADYAVGARTGRGHFTYDAPGSYVVVDDDDARWLVGEESAPVPEPVDDLRQARERRMSAVPAGPPPAGADVDRAEELPLGDDAIELVSEDDALGAPLDDTGTAEMPAAPPAVEEPVAEDPVAEDPAAEDPVIEERPEAEPAEEPARRPRRKGRASVPSWDEIMFGGGDAPR